MDRELWTIVLAAIKRAARVVERLGRRPTYADWLIVAMYLWCVWHDRPLCWACDRTHYGSLFRPRKLPSVSQFTRRVKSDTVQQILQRVHDELSEPGVMTDLGYLDGKPLPVSPVSKDRQATRGHIPGGMAKGYKLHAFVNRRRRIVVWSVMGLNVAEQSVATQLLPRLPPLAPEALVLMDANYDSATLQKLSDTLPGVCLLTPLKGQKRVGGQGHHPVTLRQMGATRRALVRVWGEHPDLTRFVLEQRDEIERAFGVLTCTAGGLADLPAWVRTLSRVRRWVGVKIILYNARLNAQERLLTSTSCNAAA
jgi:hypothetical protein